MSSDATQIIALTAGRPATTATNDIAVLVPACNEAEAILDTLSSIGAQTVPAAVIVVVLNNCRDNTGDLVRGFMRTNPEHNVCLLEMPSNPHRKAGALNYGYEYIRSVHPHVRYLVQMDGDSVLHPEFIARTHNAMGIRRNWNVGALSCAFVGRFGLAKTTYQRIVMVPQRLEYTRYQDSMSSRDTSVVSGTGNMLRIEALDRLKRHRGFVWASDTLVEDYELSLALREDGWRCGKSRKFIVYTDLMPDVKSLFKQRLRWQRGTFDELRRYGLRSYTSWDWGKQIGHGLLMLLHIAGLGYLVYVLIQASLGRLDLAFHPAIGVLLGLLALRQAYHVRSLGWRHITISLLIVPEEAYNFLRHAWWVSGLWMSLRGKQQSW